MVMCCCVMFFFSQRAILRLNDPEKQPSSDGVQEPISKSDVADDVANIGNNIEPRRKRKISKIRRRFKVQRSVSSIASELD